MVIFQFANCKRLPEGMAHQPTQVETSLGVHQVDPRMRKTHSHELLGTVSKRSTVKLPLRAFKNFCFHLVPSIIPIYTYIYIYIYYSSMSYKDFFFCFVRNSSRPLQLRGIGQICAPIQSECWRPLGRLRGSVAKWPGEGFNKHFWPLIFLGSCKKR